MKRSFGILTAILSIITFSLVVIYIMQNSALNTKLSSDKYYYLQSSLHIEFAKEYINSLKEEDLKLKSFDLSDDKYNILIELEDKKDHLVAHIFVSPKEYNNISLYEKVDKEHISKE